MLRKDLLLMQEIITIEGGGGRQPKVEPPVDEGTDNKDIEAKLNQIINDITCGKKTVDEAKAALEHLGITPNITTNGNKTTLAFQYNGTNYIFNVTNASTANPSEESSTGTPTVPTFSEKDLSGLDKDSIQTYFIKQDNGTYIFNTDKLAKDFPGKQITTVNQLKQALAAKKEVDNNSSTNSYTKENLKNTYRLTDRDIALFFNKNGDKYEINNNAVKSCFGKEVSNVSELMEAMKGEFSIGYVYGAYGMNNEKYLKYLIKNGTEGNTTFKLNLAEIAKDFPNQQITTLGQLKEIVDSGTTRTDNSTTVTAENLTDTDKTPAEEETSADTSSTKAAAQSAIEALNANDTGAVRANRISSTINSLEQEYASNHDNKTKVNTGYLMYSSGNMAFKDSFVQTMFNDLFAHIKEVIGTDGFDEQTLKQLYQTAWEMTYSNYKSNQENDISDFLTKVYDNFKKVMNRLKDKPEYLDIFTGRTNGTSTGGTRAVNAANQTTGGGYVKCDKNTTVYNDGSVHVSDNDSDANLQKSVKALIEKLQNAYPDMPQATLKSMVYAAVKKAVENIGNRRTEELPSNYSFNGTQTYANTISNLALHYFEQALYNKALTDNSLLSGNKTEETPGVTVTDADKTKWQTAASSINNMLTDIFDPNYINGLLTVNDCQGKHWLEMDVSSNGTINFTDTKTKKAYDALLTQLKSKSGFKNSGLSSSEFDLIYKAAWLDTYNSFNNNDLYDLNTVLNKVIGNIQKILNKLKTNPEYLQIVQNGSAMSQVANDTTKIHYGNTDVNRDYGDGNVHLSDDESDKKYQKAIEELRTKLKGKYVPPMSISQFNTWFTQAQKDAIIACQNNTRDITKGLQHKDGTRKKDNSNIYIGEIMELIAYKFDKLVYKNVFGYTN